VPIFPFLKLNTSEAALCDPLRIEGKLITINESKNLFLR
jgi:hypothetical protein